jgi:hypothetical protein
VAECEEWGEVGWGQAENFGGQACVIVVIGGVVTGCWCLRGV